MECGIATLGGNPASSGGGTPSPPGAAGWELAAEFWFRDQPDQDVNDGAQSIGGLTFTGFNEAAAATWRVQNGAGLQFTAAGVGGTTGWTDAGQTATNLRIDVEDFIPDYDPTRRYLFQCLLAVNNADAISERACFSIIRPVGVPTGATAIAMAWTFSGHNGTSVMGGFGSSNSGGTGSVDYTFANGFDVLSFALSPGSGSGVQGYLAQSGGTGTWPAQTAQRPVTANQLTGNPLAITAAEWLDPRCQLAFAFPTGNSSGTFSATVAGFRALVS